MTADTARHESTGKKSPPAELASRSGAVLDAFVFDMDGVVTDTANAHFAAWKRVFNDALRHHVGTDAGFRPFTRRDYLNHVDGIPRLAGVRAFLKSRDIDLPIGDADDDSLDTINGLSALKNRHFQNWLDLHEVPVFEDAITFIAALRKNGIRVGIFSASRNARRVLESAGVRDLFEVVISGADAADHDLAPKPDPAMLTEAARRLGVDPGRTAVAEDAVAGVEAGSRGRFALVVGVNRQDENANAQRHALRARGADLVVRDLRRLLTADQSRLRTVCTIPSAWERRRELEQRIEGRRLAAFLDYDGTLTPIVRDFRKADIAQAMVRAVGQLSRQCPTAIVSGRDVADVQGRVGLHSVFYAGSHGFDICGPDGLHEQPEGARDFLRSIDEAEQDLRRAIKGINGAEIERKTFAIAVHFRQAADEDVGRLEQSVDDVVGRYARLHRSRGKKILEIQPRADWDKGEAVEWLLANTRIGAGNPLPLYIGDDTTDEDAFAALDDRGISIVVRGEERVSTADYALNDVEDVRRFIEWLTARQAEKAK